MAQENIVTPTLGESVSEATIAGWKKAKGDAVKKDELLVELETDKVTLEVTAPADGVLVEIKANEGDSVVPEDVLGVVDTEGSASSDNAAEDKKEDDEAPKENATAEEQADEVKEEKVISNAPQVEGKPTAGANLDKSGPAVRKAAAESGFEGQGQGSGKDGRYTKDDVAKGNEGKTAGGSTPSVHVPASPLDTHAREERVKMSKLRQVIAKRLKDSQNTAAILTTFNEIDMTDLIAFRSKYKEQFQKQYGTKLGFMSFFIKASIQALKELPAVNAEINGDEIIYKNYYDIGVAVGTEQGLVVPVIRDADKLSMAEIEDTIVDFGKRAREGKIQMSELTGGTFTISNGGVYGSLMSTPIINPPQSGILGMHKTMKRPMVMPDGSIEARDMMYIALSYDHRIIDGREAVTFLVRVKECLEDPARMILGV